MQFATAFPEREIVAELWRQLTWAQFKPLVPAVPELLRASHIKAPPREAAVAATESRDGFEDPSGTTRRRRFRGAMLNVRPPRRDADGARQVSERARLANPPAFADGR